MVRKRGQENGLGVWEVDGYQQIEQDIQSQLTDFSPEFILDSIYVFGSYGAGYGVPGESDLDIILSGVFNTTLSDSEIEIIQNKLAESIETSGIVEEYPEINGIEVFVEDPKQAKATLQLYQSFEPVEVYYNLTTDTREFY